ncbi:MAG: hypothetical protein CHACPFDD_03217 [Phycisphaerae bacterium]|nr:hypothetical protein [Phycisphaerae bacterium]
MSSPAVCSWCAFWADAPRRAGARAVARAGLLLASLALAVGCNPAPPTVNAGASAPSPSAVVQALRAHLAARRYGQMSELILAEQASAVVRYLMAMDDFLTANAQLREFIAARISDADAHMLDFSHLAGNMDIFSPYVAIVSEHVEGDVATVAYTIDQRLPVRHARLLRVNGTWRYDPGAGYEPEIIPAVAEMAQGFRRTLAELKSGKLDPEALRGNSQRLFDEVRIRIQPGLKMMPTRAAPAQTAP